MSAPVTQEERRRRGLEPRAPDGDDEEHKQEAAEKRR
jgi:hypothetical protein